MRVALDVVGARAEVVAGGDERVAVTGDVVAPRDLDRLRDEFFAFNLLLVMALIEDNRDVAGFQR